MALSTAFLQAQLDALETAIMSGSLRISFNAGGTTKDLTYRSMGEMMQARELIRRKLGGLVTRAYVSVAKGTDYNTTSAETSADFDQDSNDWEDYPSIR